MKRDQNDGQITLKNLVPPPPPPMKNILHVGDY